MIVLIEARLILRSLKSNCHLQPTPGGFYHRVLANPNETLPSSASVSEQHFLIELLSDYFLP